MIPIRLLQMRFSLDAQIRFQKVFCVTCNATNKDDVRSRVMEVLGFEKSTIDFGGRDDAPTSILHPR